MNELWKETERKLQYIKTNTIGVNYRLLRLCLFRMKFHLLHKFGEDLAKGRHISFLKAGASETFNAIEESIQYFVH